MERARGGVPSVGVVKRRVLRGLWRRLVGVGIIGPGLSGSGLYNALGRAFLTPLLAWPRSSYPTSSVSLRFTQLKRCAGASVVRLCPSSVGRPQNCPKRSNNFLLFAAPAFLIGLELPHLPEYGAPALRLALPR